MAARVRRVYAAAETRARVSQGRIRPRNHSKALSVIGVYPPAGNQCRPWIVSW